MQASVDKEETDSEVSQSVSRDAKPKLSEKRLEQLRAAREKALAKKRELSMLATKERELKNKELEMRIASLAPKKKIKMTKVLPSSSSSSSSSSCGSDEEAEKHEVATQKSPPNVKTSKSLPTRSELTAEVARHALRERLAKETEALAFLSLFPGYRHGG